MGSDKIPLVTDAERAEFLRVSSALQVAVAPLRQENAIVGALLALAIRINRENGNTDDELMDVIATGFSHNQAKGG